MHTNVYIFKTVLNITYSYIVNCKMTSQAQMILFCDLLIWLSFYLFFNITYVYETIGYFSHIRAQIWFIYFSG
jgi:hypothetical protein